jgi:tetratricopeptide (TPR) repeat protein
MSDPVLSTGRDATDAPPVEQAAVRRSSGMFGDPVVRLMGVVAFVIVIAYLVVVASALMTGVLSSSAPRTAAERDLDFAESAVKSGDNSAKAIAAYANALIGVGQYGQAQVVIDGTPNAAKGSPLADVQLAQVTLYYSQKDYARAISAADVTLKVIKTNYDADLKKPGMNASKSYGLDDNYYAAMMMKGLSQQASGDLKGALASYDEYLSKNPMESNILVYRGQVKQQLKDAAGAKADFQAALKFDPTNKLALDELKKIGAK